jgi:hypothetical protein
MTMRPVTLPSSPQIAQGRPASKTKGPLTENRGGRRCGEEAPRALLNFEVASPAKSRKPETIVEKLKKALIADESVKACLRRAAVRSLAAQWRFEYANGAALTDLRNQAHTALAD